MSTPKFIRIQILSDVIYASYDIVIVENVLLFAF